MFYRFSLAILVIFAMVPAFARPISYVDGTMLMLENDQSGHSVEVDYTFSPTYAIGLFARHESNGREFTTVGPQVNARLSRWNMPNGQANIYAVGGLGVSHFEGDEEGAAWAGLQADVETRRYYASYEARALYAGDIEKMLTQRARLGIAPYEGGYNEVNSWFMLQFDHHPAKNDTFVVTPLMRFFYKTTLVEAGYSSNNHVLFNFTQQF